jgi:hypothetical protein
LKLRTAVPALYDDVRLNLSLKIKGKGEAKIVEGQPILKRGKKYLQDIKKELLYLYEK